MADRDRLFHLDAHETRKRFAALLRRARDEAGIEQAGLGKAVGVSTRTLSRWENGRASPSTRQVDALLSALRAADADTLQALAAVAGPPRAAEQPSLPADDAPDAPDAQGDDDGEDDGALLGAGRQETASDGARAAIDQAVRAYAEELDVSARKLRAVLSLFLCDLERLNLGVVQARELVLRKDS